MADFRLGGQAHAAPDASNAPAVLLPSADLTTHGVIVGMTGSGKTGLGVVLIEEALRSGVPALLIDPKGDLTNLALTFPDLAPEEFEPWVNSADVRSAGTSPAEYAIGESQRWRDGLGGWGLAAADVRALHEAADVTIYTPGSSHGTQLNIIGTLDAPTDRGDAQATAEEISAYVSSGLNLVGIAADPLSSREHILLSTLIDHFWEQGRSLDLPGLVAAVLDPPIRKVGVLDLDAYFPGPDRSALAVRLNGLLASPAFSAWLGGQRIDIESMLFTPEGSPRCAVITTAHLDDSQRQSVTSVILAKVISWMRRQAGTSDLRALLYLDEVAGYLPPTANPPTKAPLLLLLKQARAFGLGVVLATQNPVDLDYKALSNAGTWLIGRLQTEQDKARLLDGLADAAGTVDTAAAADTISGLAARQFLLKRVTGSGVEVLGTRWAMSYLPGPLTRDQITRLTPADPAEDGTDDTTRAAATSAPRTEPVEPQDPGSTVLAAGRRVAGDDESSVAPRVAPGIATYYLDPAASWAADVNAVPGRTFAAGAVARVALRFDEAKADLTHDDVYEAVLFPVTENADAQDFVAMDYDDRDLRDRAPDAALYRLPQAPIATKTWWTSLRRDLVDHLYRTRSVTVPANPSLKLYGRIGETDEQFAQRARKQAEARADDEVATLTRRYEKKITALQRRIDTAARKVAREESERTSTLASDLLGGLFGRSTLRASARRAGSAQRQLEAARDRHSELSAGLADLRDELDEEAEAIRQRWQDAADDTQSLEVPMEKSDVQVRDIAVVWIPVAP